MTLNDRPAAGAERLLGASESALWAADAVVPIHFTTFVTLRGPLDEDLLREALLHMQRRHPPLRVRILEEGPDLWFREVAAPLPLTVRDAGEDEIEGALAAACLERVDPSCDALLHAIWLRHSPERSTLLLRFHHAIGDGKSGVFLARDLIETCNRRLRDGPGFTPLPALGGAPSVESLLGLEEITLGTLGRFADALASFGCDVLRLPAILALPRDRPAPYHRRTLTVVRHPWTQRETRALVSAARRERTTVHGALMAGLTLATLTSAGHGGPTGAVLGSPIDVRTRGRRPVGDELGFYVSMLASAHRVDPETYFWRLAREIRAAMLSGIDRDQHLHFVPPHMALVGSLARAHPRRFFDLTVGLRPPTTTGITNIGRFDLGSSGPVHFEHGGFAASPSFASDFVSTATTLEGRLVWTFCAYEPIHARARAEALLGEARARVLAACGGD